MEFVHQGNQLFVEEQYEQARDKYTKAIAKLLGKQQFPALFARARTNMYLETYYNAIRDFGECLSFDHEHQLTNYYLGECLMKIGKHDLEKMKNAHKYLLIAQNGTSKQSRFEKAVQKSIKILQKLQPKIEISNDIPKSENPSNAEPKTTIDDAKENGLKQLNDAQQPQTQSAEAPKVSKPKLRESWYQTASQITFTLYAKNLTKEDVSIKFASKNVLIELQFGDEMRYTRRIELKHEIKAKECTFSLTKYKIILTLIKDKVGDWDGLESVIDDGKKPSIAAPWTTKRDWAEVDQYAEKELEKDKPEGDEALQSLFSKIYNSGDDDQRRAMIKSFQTSGGTVLSTNWNEVKEKDYEGKDKVLPTGQDKAKWEY